MILRTLRVERFGRFDEGEWEFAPGLTVIRGPNEAGKSTMREAIVRLLLPGKKIDTTDAGFLSLVTWRSDRRFVLSCEFECECGRFSLTRDFEHRRVELRCAATGELLTSEPAVAERLRALLQVGSREVYETTACLAQQEFTRLQAGSKVAELLQQTVSGSAARGGAQAVIADLAKQLEELNRGVDRPAPTNPGPIRATMDQISRLRDQIARLSPIVERAGTARDRIARARDRIAELERALDDGTGVLKRAQERRTVEEALEGLNRDFATLDARAREARELAERIARAEEALARLPEVQPEQAEEFERLLDEAKRAEERVPEAQSQVRAAAEAADRALARLREVEANAPDERLVEKARCAERDITQMRLEAERAQAAVAEAERDVASAGAATRSRGTLLAVAAALVLAGAGLAIGLDAPWLWIVSAAGVVMGVMGLLQRPPVPSQEADTRRHEAATAERDLQVKLAQAEDALGTLLRDAAVADVDALAARVQEARAALDEAREQHAAAAAVAGRAAEEADRAGQHAQITAARLQHRLEQLGAEDPQAFLRAAQDVFRLRDEQEKHRRERKGVLGAQTPEEINARLSELAAERMGLQQRLASDELAFAALDSERYEALQRQINDAEGEREQLREEADAVRGAADHPEADPERLRSLHEQLAASEAALQRADERRAALELARELLAQAHEETLEQAADVLEPRTAQLLETITGGRYGAITFDRATLAPTVQSDEKGEGANPSELSCATREQVYLAARLALTELLWPEECPPIILDDPFVNFDEARRAQAVQVVKRLARRRQVLLFTCEKLYDAEADAVVELDAP